MPLPKPRVIPCERHPRSCWDVHLPVRHLTGIEWVNSEHHFNQADALTSAARWYAEVTS